MRSIMDGTQFHKRRLIVAYVVCRVMTTSQSHQFCFLPERFCLLLPGLSDLLFLQANLVVSICHW